MKGNELDDLFRQKLGNHKLTPPAGSWDKIESNLAKTEPKGVAFWFRIAVGLVLLFTLGWLIIPTQDDVVPTTTAALDEKAPSSENSDQVKPVQLEDKGTQLASQTPPPQKEEIKQPVLAEPSKTEPATLLAAASPKGETIEAEDLILPEPRIVIDIEEININLAVASLGISPSFPKSEVLPLDLSLKHTYADGDNEEFKTRKKFSVIGGIISIAKGVNKSKLGFEGIRSAKNGFINDGLKYGVQETDEETEKKDVDDGKNAGDQNKNAGDLK